MNLHPQSPGFGNSHPPQPPFPWKGEAHRLPPRFFTPFGTKEAAAKRRGDASRLRVCLALMFVAGSATAAIGPNILAVQQSQLQNYWVMNNTSLYADAPDRGTNLDKPACSAVTYMIGSDGVTRDIVVRKTVPAGGLGKVAASTVKNMHYAPAADNPGSEPVFTYIVIGFNLPDNPAESKKIRDACALPGFPNGYR